MALVEHAPTDVRGLRGAPSVAMGATPHLVHDTECPSR
jgi:hypothetical protein